MADVERPVRLRRMKEVRCEEREDAVAQPHACSVDGDPRGLPVRIERLSHETATRRLGREREGAPVQDGVLEARHHLEPGGRHDPFEGGLLHLRARQRRDAFAARDMPGRPRVLARQP